MNSCSICKKYITTQLCKENGGCCYNCVGVLLKKIKDPDKDWDEDEDEDEGWLDHPEFNKKLSDVTGSKGCEDIETCEGCQ